jgi:hypothetical protein
MGYEGCKHSALPAHTDMKSLCKALLCTACAVLIAWTLQKVSVIHAQVSPSSSLAVSANQIQTETAEGQDARSQLQAVLNGLGGNAWKTVHASVATVTITAGNGAARQVQWSDDWSGPALLTRRESVDKKDGSHTAISNGLYQYRHLADGSQKSFAASPDIVRMVEGYPGAALLRSLKRSNCIFAEHPIMPGKWPTRNALETNGDKAIYQSCLQPLFPGGKCNIVWHISSEAATLLGVWIPIQGQLHNSIAYEEIRYDAYRHLSGLTMPSRLTVIRPSGRIDKVLIGPPEFSEKLPSDNFKFHD